MVPNVVLFLEMGTENEGRNYLGSKIMIHKRGMVLILGCLNSRMHGLDTNNTATAIQSLKS